MKLKTFAFLFAVTFGNSAFAAACLPAPLLGEDVQLLDKSGSVRLVEQDNVDNPVQSTLMQAYAFVDVKPAPSEEQVRGALSQLFSNARGMCRRNALSAMRIFLYTSPATAISSSWVARLNTEKMKPTIDIHDNMLRATTKADAQACVSGKAPGKSLHLYPKLPPVAKRKILGTWADDPGLTVSLEDVSGTVYKVYRDKYCTSGNEGEPLQRGKQDRFYRKDSRSGDYYVILPGGELGVFDNDGKIDARPAHAGLFPRQ